MSLRTLSASVLVSVLSLSALIPVASAASFSDVASTHVHAEAIAYVKAEGIVDGYADGTFRPDQTMNRAEFTKIILEATQERASCASASQEFSDVPRDAWFSAYVCRGKELGVIGGYPDGTFRPGNAINLAEAAKIIAQAQGYSVTADASVWYRGSVEALGERKAIPVSIDSFEKKLTRGEMAEMIWRLKAGVTTRSSATFESLSSAKTAQKNSPIAYRGSDYGGMETIFTLELPADWVGFGAMLGDPRTIAYIGDATTYGTRNGGAHMEVTRVLTNENTHGRQEGQSWFDFYIGAENPRFIVTKQEKRGSVQYYELTAKDQREFPFPYFFLFETDEAIVGLAFKQNDITTQSIVASFAFKN